MGSPDPFIVGAGRVGTALALALARAGRPPRGLWSRSRRAAERAQALSGLPCSFGALPEAIGAAPLVLLAVADPAVPAVAGALLDGGLLRSARVVLHCGGARAAAEALACLGPPIARGTFHPLLAIADPERGAARLAGAAIIIEGEEEARRCSLELGSRLGARVLALAAGGLTLYHAAAVLASNHAVALWAEAEALLGRAGLAEAERLPALLPLLQSTLENVAALGLPAALTGPVRRGDAERVAAHLAALEQAAPELLPLYRAASAAALRLAEAAGDPALSPGLRQIAALLGGEGPEVKGI